MDCIDVKLTELQRGETTVQLSLAAVSSELLPAFRAGAHILVEVAPDTWRAYSLCQSPTQRARYRLVLGTRFEAGSPTGTFLAQAQVGQTLRIQPPRDYFRLASTAGRHLLFGAGTGLTPLISMAHELQDQGQDFLFYIAGSRQDSVPLSAELQASAFADKLRWLLDGENPPAEAEARYKQRLAPLQALLGEEGDDTHLYACGPTGFIEAVLDAGRYNDWGEERLHREHFAPPPPGTVLGEAFDVEIASSGARLHIPADRSLAEVLCAHGVQVPLSCGMGLCGTCVIPVKSGAIEHHDHHLDKQQREAGKLMAACCSRAAQHSSLILEL